MQVSLFVTPSGRSVYSYVFRDAPENNRSVTRGSMTDGGSSPWRLGCAKFGRLRRETLAPQMPELD
ncbi:MAG: hypothetical protein CMJ64_28015 [Planctomycetaceae bacterium]|nr:hypothetical protein [Planctomycetaceae bacterium]